MAEIKGDDMKKTVWLIIVLTSVGMFALTGPLGAVSFTYEDLGNLGYPQYNGNEAFGINDAGQVVGYAYTSYGTWPFVKSPGQAMQPLLMGVRPLPLMDQESSSVG